MEEDLNRRESENRREL